jgi:hypothetical protein
MVWANEYQATTSPRLINGDDPVPHVDSNQTAIVRERQTNELLRHRKVGQRGPEISRLENLDFAGLSYLKGRNSSRDSSPKARHL